MPRIFAFVFGLLIATHAVIAHAALDVVTTTTDLAHIVKTVGGPHVSVESITKGTQDPHYVQAKPSYMVKLSRADLLVSVGLELEIGWLPALIRGARNPDINPGKPGYLDASAAITPIDVPQGKVDRSQGDVHPLGNPHYWLDPENVRRLTQHIATRLSQLDPSHAGDYDKNAKAYRTRLEAAIKRWKGQLAAYAGADVVSYHRTFNYFLKAFSLSPIGYIEDRPGIPPGPSHLAALIRTMRKANVGVILHESYFDKATTELVARKTDAAVLLLPTSVAGSPQASSYEKLMDHLVTRVAQALKERK